mmetsp:Transcript_52188/g.148772  ORF Transcript_52188/g.148772 Transcript_52188/m.148772 type:complete len:121 (+) Transcript_52188:1200-1562(+)
MSGATQCSPQTFLPLASAFLCWRGSAPPWHKAMLSDSMFAFVQGKGDRGIEALLQHWKKPLLGPEAMQLVVQLLRPDPAQRPSAAACLASPWFVGFADAARAPPQELAGADARPSVPGGS